MSAASEREKVLAEFMPCSGEVCKGCELICQHEDGRTPQAEWMADEIVRLRETIRHLACPRCGTVNPPEVHTCTPRATCTVEERAHLDTHPIGAAETRYLMLYRSLTSEHQKQVRDYADMLATQHTVRRVALVEETRG